MTRDQAHFIGQIAGWSAFVVILIALSPYPVAVILWTLFGATNAWRA